MIRLAVLLVGMLVTACGGASATPTAVQFVPPVECLGIPAVTCNQIVTDARQNAAPGTVPLHIRAVCATPPCTLQQGNVDVEVEYSDGRRDRYGMGWSGPGAPAEPPPVPAELPVEPICQAVPTEPCRDRASEFVGSLDATAEIRSIVVRCTSVCTLTAGEGETVVTLADGPPFTSGWAYASGPAEPAATDPPATEPAPSGS